MRSAGSTCFTSHAAALLHASLLFASRLGFHVFKVLRGLNMASARVAGLMPHEALFKHVARGAHGRRCPSLLLLLLRQVEGFAMCCCHVMPGWCCCCSCDRGTAVLCERADACLLRQPEVLLRRGDAWRLVGLLGGSLVRTAVLEAEAAAGAARPCSCCIRRFCASSRPPSTPTACRYACSYALGLLRAAETITPHSSSSIRPAQPQ